jgi:asparagine synthase (glutamine-hydrolysing)
MCGIAGIVSYSGNAPIETEELVAIQQAMASRGPDGSGVWIEKSGLVGFAHNRLAIIDLSDDASQPMVSADDQYVITFNGEIYNYRELKSELTGLGHHFRTRSDTEVLLELYRKFGEGMLHRLRGMYAFAIWDTRNQCLFAARDPFGIKPLYYSDDGHVLRFASQVKAIVKGEGIRLSPSPAGRVGFFLLGQVPEPHTLYRQINALPAGCTLSLRRDGKPVIRRFYDLRQKFIEAEELRGAAISEEKQAEIVSAALQDSVRHHLVSDVPVGVFLSAGIDSNVIATAASSASDRKVVAITMAFHEYVGTSNDESRLASQQAAVLGIPHSVHLVSAEEFFGNLENIWSAMDQPSIDGINSWLVSKTAAEAGLKVCLSGLGGDELFGGYPSFRQIPQLVDLISRISAPRAAQKAWSRLVRTLPERWMSPKYSALLKLGRTRHGAYLLRRGLFAESELTDLLDQETARAGIQELNLEGLLEASTADIHADHGAIAAMELSWYMRNQLLRDTDWASMAHGLEVRTPLVDTRFFEALLPLMVSGNPPGKDILSKAVAPPLVDGIRSRAKTGFTTPVSDWLHRADLGCRSRRGQRGWACATYARFVPETSVGKPKDLMPQSPTRPPVLVFRIGQLGDTAVALPALSALREQQPDAPIVLMTNRNPGDPQSVSAWDLIGASGMCDAVVFYDVSSHPLRNALTRFRLLRKVRAMKPREVVNLAPRKRAIDLWRDRVFFRVLCGVPRYSSFESGDKRRGEPEWRLLLNVIGPSAKSSDFRLRIPRWASHEARHALGQIPECKTLVAISPGSRMPAKRWPVDRYKEVGLRLFERNSDLTLVIVGAAEDHALGEELQGSWGDRSLNLCGMLSVYGSAAVLRRCALFIGNDSGAMHLAGLVGTPCVALFSARDVPGKWDPMGTGNRILRTDVPCAGCMLTECDKNNLCLTKIQIDDVLSASNEVMAAQAN